MFELTEAALAVLSDEEYEAYWAALQDAIDPLD